MQVRNTHIDQLIESCKKGSQSAQFEVYQLYYRAMFNTSLRIVQNSYEAEDVMQEAFLNAFTKLDSFKGEVAFGAWLKRIVINRSLTQLNEVNRLAKWRWGTQRKRRSTKPNVAPRKVDSPGDPQTARPR